MKTKTLFYMALMAVMTTLAACSQDDELMDAAPKQAQIEFEITDGGYGGDEATRAVEEGLRTKFEAGDECGLYIIDNGKFKASNVKLTAEEGENGEITWKAADGAISGVTENSKYFLYYPYNENDRKVQLGDNDKTVFQNDIEEWGLSWYQNTHVQYARGDLMTATGTASTGADGKLKVSFSLTHQMALAVIELPKTVYKFINEDVTIPDYTVALSADFSSSNYRPLRMEDGTYRFVFNPLRVEYGIIGIVNGNKKFTISAEKLKGIEKGTYKTFRIGGADATKEEQHTLQVGDYLMKDGSLISKDALTEDDRGNVAAVVFSAGHNLYDKSDYSETGIGTVKCHGYAVALENAISRCTWGSTSTKLGLCPSGEINNLNSPEKDWSGYLYTQTIIKAVNDAGNSLKGNSADGYPATYYAVNYSTEAPATTSGWFLPAIGQLKEVWQQKGMFTGTVGAAPLSFCWSSSEYSGNQDNVLNVNFYDSNINSVTKAPNENSVRAILAF